MIDIDYTVLKDYLIINLNAKTTKVNATKLIKILKLFDNINKKNIIINLNDISSIDDYERKVILNIASKCKKNLSNLYIYAK